ncbi:SEL1-like repeat protein [Alistipes sp. OttesenSCG-928-B03]|nr:SEL1-like repeat protein [Alistipes sp. OttesenSCG-928-B03]
MKRILLIFAIVIACFGGLYVYLTWNGHDNPRFMHHRYNKVVTQPLAKIGFADAQYKMGLFHIEGAINPPSEEYDTKADLEQAIYWWDKASAKGHEKSKAELTTAKQMQQAGNYYHYTE